MKKHVLITDDSYPFRKIVKEIVEENNSYDVREASNGIDALHLLQKGGFDLLITDLSVPKMNGIELVDKLRRGGYSIPIIVVSASVDHKNRDYLRAQESVYIIEKPFHI